MTLFSSLLSKGFLFLSLILLCLNISAQHGLIPVSADMLQIQKHPDFPEADAIMLLDYGATTIEQGPQGWRFATHHTNRIQILSEAGKEEANVRLVYYTRKNAELVANVFASIYYLENGRMITKKLSQKDIFREKINDDYSVVSFAFPNAKVGAIIQYEFDRYQENITSIDWYFQGDLPVLKSRYSFLSNRYFEYSFMFQGLWNDKLERNGGVWVMRNLPAAREESYVSNLRNYQPKMMVQMSKYLDQRINKVVNFLNSWDQLT
ncbi:MAG: DUF3857 domain-containing protein, partial [Bacteroidota bacterium]